MSERPGGPPEDAPLPPHLDPRGRRGRRGRAPAGGSTSGGTARGAAGPAAGAGSPAAGSSAGPSAGTAATVLPPELDPRGRRPTPSAPSGGRGRRRARTVLLTLAVVLLLVVVAGLGTVAWYDRRIDRIPVAALGDGTDPDGGDRNYLLVGTDSRKGLTEEELQAARTTAKDDDGSLTDTVIVLHVPAGGGTPTLVSFPRDSWVELPNGERGRINSAYALGERQRSGGGPSALVETVEQVSGLQLDHYIEVGFIAFLRLTDAVGGVQVNLCQPAQDPDSGIDLPAGEQQLDGSDALAFVRQRNGLPRGDLDRVARQQYFLGAVARETLAPSTLLRPDRALRLADAVTSSIRADEDLSAFDLARLAWRLRGAAGGGLAFTTVPVADPAAMRGGASVVLLDEPALPGFFAGLSPEQEQTQAAPPPVAVAPSAIRLQVRNGTSRAGLARSAADDLAGQGFTVTGTGNADRQDATESVVLHGSNRADSAQTVLAAVPGAVARQDDSVGANGLVLVVGENYRGTQPVTVAPPPGQAPAAPPPAPAQPDAPAPAAPPESSSPCIT